MTNVFDIVCISESIKSLINEAAAFRGLVDYEYSAGLSNKARHDQLLALSNLYIDIVQIYVRNKEPLKLGLIRNGSHYIAKPLRGDDVVYSFLEILRNRRVMVVIVDLSNELLDMFIARVTAYRWWPAIYIPKRLSRLAENYWVLNEPLMVFLGTPNKRCMDEVITYEKAIELEWRMVMYNVTGRNEFPRFDITHVIPGDP
ncbi:hypothetical protein [Vulcanisaeta souniana]|uniref:Uncharacterized protein n=1 Tax=Vulcanisaeta souniana JCM 11219 TaxID=1293586 RepID=A0A830EHY0_9CREN|nr:hypothetical protein [Vulcanisaeta souniana]BDR92674.1 hypothetical protein Vsou_17670 [Vulcanisaeta souniana JCM 11219]GGI84476.1 hypothetical protein GCM10007112_21800 [Vulcanisaeta souniana JCM 11219]